MKRKKSRSLIPVIALLVAALAVGYVVYYITAQNARSKVYEQLQEEVTPQIVEAEEPAEPVEEVQTEEEVPEEIPEPEKPPYVSEIDFAALEELNPDIYAWISIPDTEIAYPVLRGNYYLDHTVEKASGLPGALFTDEHSAEDFSGFNSVIYGHNMKNGSMFGSLKKYRDEDFLKEHRQIVIYTPESKLTYQVFAAVIYDDRMIQDTFDETVAEDREAFLESIWECRDMNSHILDDVEVNPDSRIITLSTCVGQRPNNRYLVLAVLTDEEK